MHILNYSRPKRMSDEICRLRRTVALRNNIDAVSILGWMGVPHYTNYLHDHEKCLATGHIICGQGRFRRDTYEPDVRAYAKAKAVQEEERRLLLSLLAMLCNAHPVDNAMGADILTKPNDLNSCSAYKRTPHISARTTIGLYHGFTENAPTRTKSGTDDEASKAFVREGSIKISPPSALRENPPFRSSAARRDWLSSITYSGHEEAVHSLPEE